MGLPMTQGGRGISFASKYPKLEKGCAMKLCRRSLLVGSAIYLLAPSTVQATPFAIGGPGAANVDTNPATVVSLVTALPGVITDLNIFIDIRAGHSEDWGVSLRHFDTGTTVSLYDGTHFPPHSGNFVVTLDDESPGPVITTGAAGGGDLVGSFKPLNPLSAFDGESLAGTWQLIILDDFVPGEGDDLIQWTLTGDAQAAVPEPASLGLLGVGLAVLAYARKRHAA